MDVTELKETKRLTVLEFRRLLREGKREEAYDAAREAMRLHKLIYGDEFWKN